MAWFEGAKYQISCNYHDDGLTWLMTLLGRLPICWRLVIMSDESNSFPTNKKTRVVRLSQ